MKHLKNFKNYRIVENATPKNYKQENAIRAWNRPQIGEYVHDPAGDTEYTKKIYDFLEANGMGYDVGSSKGSFYFMNKIPAGDVRGFKNTEVAYVSISSDYNVTFHIVFEVENPNMERIQQLKQEMKKYDSLSKEEFELVKDEFRKLMEEENELNKYIPNFTYAYSQSFDPAVIKNVYEEMVKSENIERSKYIDELKDKIYGHRFKIENLPYANKLDYWDWMDELEDLTSYRTPSEEDLVKRKRRREKSEEDYNKEQQRMIDILKNL